MCVLDQTQGGGWSVDREEGEEHVGVLHAVDTGGEGLHFVLPHRNRKKKIY